jgi:hypothetical protein
VGFSSILKCSVAIVLFFSKDSWEVLEDNISTTSDQVLEGLSYALKLGGLNNGLDGLLGLMEKCK